MARKLVIASASSISPKTLGEGVASRRLITGPKDGSDRFMLSLLRIEPRSNTKGVYEDKDEALYILRGHLTLRYDHGEKTIGPEDAVFIPMGQYLEMANNGNEPVELIAVIAPSKTAAEL